MNHIIRQFFPWCKLRYYGQFNSCKKNECLISRLRRGIWMIDAPEFPIRSMVKEQEVLFNCKHVGCCWCGHDGTDLWGSAWTVFMSRKSCFNWGRGHRQLSIGSLGWLDMKVLLGRWKWGYWIQIHEWGIRKLWCWILRSWVWATWHCHSVQSFPFRNYQVCVQNVIFAYIHLIQVSDILITAGLTNLLGPSLGIVN